MEWIILAAVLLFGLVFGAVSPEIKTRFKMDQSRKTKHKILDDFDAEQKLTDQYSK